MVGELAFNVSMYAVPLIGLPLVGASRRALVFVFGSSFVGELAYFATLLTWGRYDGTWSGVLEDVLGFYPMAVIPLGLWAGLLGVVGVRILERGTFWWGTGIWLVLLGLVGGAAVGGLFMELYGLGVASTSATDIGDTRPWLFAGLAAGAASGLWGARSVARRTRVGER
jgi:hypothetical protein